MNQITKIDNQQSPVLTSARTDDQLILSFLDVKANSPRTLSTYECALTTWYEHVGDLPLAQTTVDDVSGYRAWLRTRYKSADTRKLKLNVVKSLLTYACTVNYLQFNVGAAVKADKAHTSVHKRVMSEEDVILAIDKTATPRNKVLVKLLYVSAGRVSEIAGLTWADVSRNDDACLVELSRKGGTLQELALKPSLYDELMTIKPDDAKPTDSIFISTRNKKDANGLTPNGIWRLVKQVGKASGIPDISPHWFRHSHVSHALERGADVVKVRDTAGHASIATTNAYAHSSSDKSSAFDLII